MTARVVREVLLTLGAVAGVVCAGLVVAGLAWGIVPLVFVSDSMAPQIPSGALAFAQPTPAAQLRVGDVVSVQAASGARVTHRIVAIEPRGDHASLILKGDRNAKPDSERYVVATADRVGWSAPGLGRMVTWLGLPPVVFGAGIIVGAWLMWWLPQRRNGRALTQVVRSS